MRRKLRFRNNADSEAADDRFAQALPAFNLKTGSTVTPLVVAAVSKAFWVVELAVRTIISSSCNSFRRILFLSANLCHRFTTTNIRCRL